MDTLTRLIEDYGYLALALSLGLGSAGLPLPGETALLVAGALAAAGHLSIGLVIAVATVAVILGDAGGYWVGRRGGRPLLDRYGSWLRLEAQKIGRIESFFARYGSKTVFFGRFISGLQTYAALFAGISRMPYASFTLYNVLGGITWAVLYGMLGYVFGRNLYLVERLVGYMGWALLAAVGLLVAAVLAWRWVANNRTRLVAYWDAILSYPPVARLRARYARQLEWLRRRLTPGQYLGLHLTLGLVIAAGGLWLFGGLAEDILTGDPLVRFDRAAATALHDSATPPATAFFLAITALGSIETIALLGLLVVVALAWQRRWLYVGAWLGAVVGAVALNLLLKQLFARPRPYFEHPLLVETSYSFPSGHAMESLVVYGMLAYLAVLVLRTWRARTAVIFGAVLLVLLIGFSRMYLGVHYFSDVVAGFAAGSVWLSALVTAIESIRRGKIGAARRASA